MYDNNDIQVETFIPYSNTKDHIMVEFVEYYRNFHTNEIAGMRVKLQGDEYELEWDEYNYHYQGAIRYNKEVIEGVIEA